MIQWRSIKMKRKFVQEIITAITVATLLTLTACGGSTSPYAAGSTATPESGAAIGESAAIGAPKTNPPENAELTPSILLPDGFVQIETDDPRTLEYERENQDTGETLTLSIRVRQIDPNVLFGDYVEQTRQNITSAYSSAVLGDTAYITVNGMDAAEFTCTTSAFKSGYTIVCRGTTACTLFYFGDGDDDVAIYDANEAIFKSMVDSFTLE